MPARSRWVSRTGTSTPPCLSGRPCRSARPSSALASRPRTSSESRSSIIASRSASSSTTWRSSAACAAGVASRNAQNASRSIAQTVEGLVAGAPAVGQQGQLAEELARADEAVELLAAATRGGDDRDLAGGDDVDVAGGFALVAHEAAARVGGRGGAGRQRGQRLGAAVLEHPHAPQQLQQEAGILRTAGHHPAPRTRTSQQTGEPASFARAAVAVRVVLQQRDLPEDVMGGCLAAASRPADAGARGRRPGPVARVRTRGPDPEQDLVFGDMPSPGALVVKARTEVRSRT